MKTRDIVYMALFTALIAAGAFIKIPIPVCPFTLQFFFTTMTGLILGSKRGAICVDCYIALGLLGVPIFASGGGIGYIFQPTFGYLIGFYAGTYLTGVIASKDKNPSVKRCMAANFAGLGVVYLFGMVYYWLIMTFYTGTGIGLWTLFLYCFLLAVPGDIVLCILAALTAPKLIYNHFHTDDVMEEDNIRMCEYLTGIKTLACISDNDNELDISAEELCELYE